MVRRPGRGLLAYASAENLSWLNRQSPPARFTGADAWNRYRVRYEAIGRKSDEFFPDVGIQPVTNGGLFAAGLFVSERLGLPTCARPRTFLEMIEVVTTESDGIKQKIIGEQSGRLRPL